LSSEDQRNWLAAALGVRFAGGINAGAIKASPVGAGITPPPASGGIGQWANRPGTGDPISVPGVVGPRQNFTGANGRALGIAVGSDGRVAFTAPPPAVTEITFAGGGGKGAALPGAVKALQDSGILKDVTVINGASVGSMSAALLACGATTEEFTNLANDPNLANQIKDGKNMMQVMFDGGLSGDGLQQVAENGLGKTLRNRGVEYLNGCINAGTKPDPAVVAVLQRLASSKTGPTFGDLRTLSKVIPSVKEVSISATYLAEIDPSTGKPMPAEKPQLAMFNADTEPDMEVALAIRASAALPPVFKPVDIALSSGITARFEDGGVLNNVPSPESVGAERQVDPMPAKSNLSFVFESEAAHEAADGQAVASRSRLCDWIAKAPNSAANYANYRGLADRPEDMVIVPLRITMPPAKPGGKGKVKDFTGMLSGTMNFDMAADDRLALQQQTDVQTTAALKQRQQPKTTNFASVEEMLMTIDRADLAALVKDGFAGAAEALTFRDDCLATIGKLVERANAMTGQGAAAMTADSAIEAGLAALDKAAGGKTERQAFVGRELTRQTALDRLVDAKKGDSQCLEAAAALNAALTAQAHAKTILRDALYPHLVEEKPKSPAGMVLSQADNRLRRAKSAQDVNGALQIVIDLYRKRRDLLNVHGYRKIADEFTAYLMPAG
jgi:exoenzyme U